MYARITISFFHCYRITSQVSLTLLLFALFINFKYLCDDINGENRRPYLQSGNIIFISETRMKQK